MLMTHQDQHNSSSELPPGQKRIAHILTWGTEHSAITQSIPQLDITHWTLRIDGEVENAVQLSWTALLQYPSITTISDFHCVEGWSVVACNWTGVPFQELVHVVHPTPQACFVTLHGADGYTTALSLEAMLQPEVLLAYQLNGKPLRPELGGPLRLVVPQKYAYKSAMWVTKITFTRQAVLGYWERQGYSQTADVWTNDRYSPARARII
jgi:DMSO/TMAO reductase YedYZ molybdopterin-dependent catalytic subunit